MEKILVGNMLDNFDTKFLLSNRTNFGFLEKENMVLWIFIQNESNKIQNTYLDNLINLLADYFLKEDMDVTFKSLKKIIGYASDELKKAKFNDKGLIGLNFSIILILSDSNIIIASSIGNVQLAVLRDDKCILLSTPDNYAYELYRKKELTKDELGNSEYLDIVTNSIGATHKLNINLIGECELEEKDIIYIRGQRAYSKNIGELTEDTVIITLLKQNKQKEVKKFHFVYLVIFFLGLIILLFLLNLYRINNFIKERDSIILNIEKNKKIQNIQNEISNLEKIYKKLYADITIYKGSKIQKLYFKDKEYILEKKKILDNYYVIQEKLENTYKYINYKEFDKAKSILESLKLLDTNLLTDKINEEILKVDELIFANNNIEKAKEYSEKNEYINAQNLYLSSKKIYDKYKIEVDFLEEIDELKNKIAELANKNNSLLEMALNNIEEHPVISLNLFEEIKANYILLNEDKEVENISNKIEDIKKNLKNKKMHSQHLKEECEILVKSDKIRLGIDCYYELIDNYKKLDLAEEIRLITNKISALKANLSKVKTDSNKKVEINRDEIITSINLSIKKGDEYMKANKWEEAIIEYERALSYSNKIEMDEGIRSKIRLKIDYARKKKNSIWWNIWS